MVFIVAVKSRTFSSLPYSADEQVCRSWEGVEPGSQPKLANENIPYHRHHAQFMNGGWPGGRKLSALLISVSLNPLLSGSSIFFRKFRISGFYDHYSGTGHKSVVRW